MVRVARLVYDGNNVRTVLCFELADSGEACYEAVYAVLDRKVFEERLARLVGEAGADQVLSYEEGELPEGVF